MNLSSTESKRRMTTVRNTLVRRRMINSTDLGLLHSQMARCMRENSARTQGMDMGKDLSTKMYWSTRANGRRISTMAAGSFITQSSNQIAPSNQRYLITSTHLRTTNGRNSKGNFKMENGMGLGSSPSRMARSITGSSIITPSMALVVFMTMKLKYLLENGQKVY